jgi:hypothetical protein
MEEEPRAGETIARPLFPPNRIRYAAAGELYDEMTEKRDDLSTKVIEAFRYEFRKSGIVSYLDMQRQNMLRHVCPVDGCDYELIDIPLRNPKDPDQVLPYYCKFHGEVMEPEGNHPLA